MTTEDGTTWEPWQNEAQAAVGFKVTRMGVVRYVYLVPSEHEDEYPNAFLYVGPEGDPCQDGAHHYYEPFTTEDMKAMERQGGQVS